MRRLLICSGSRVVLYGICVIRWVVMCLRISASSSRDIRDHGCTDLRSAISYQMASPNIILKNHRTLIVFEKTIEVIQVQVHVEDLIVPAANETPMNEHSSLCLISLVNIERSQNRKRDQIQ